MEKHTIETEFFENAHQQSVFIALVNSMRQAQRDYFKTRQSIHLENSKFLEKKVDAELQRMLGHPMNPQQSSLNLQS